MKMSLRSSSGPEVFDREPVIETRSLPLQLLEHIDRQLKSHVASAMNMNLEAFVPVHTRQRFELFGREHPGAMGSVD